MMSKKRSHKNEKEKRHYNMSCIRSQNTKIELALRKTLWHEGIRYRKNYAELPGKPDIAITKYKIAIFCDGEFWHGKDWPEKKERIHSNRDYWIPKIEKNMRRDREINIQLLALGWRVIRFWEKDIRKQLDQCVMVIKDEIFESMILESTENICDWHDNLDFFDQ
jgi:DNA mismatch endonuclease (patch repair protein)